MEQLEQDMTFSTEDMDPIDFANVEPSVSSSSLLQMLQPEGTYTSCPVLDLHEYATPLSPSIPLSELGDTVLPHDTAPDAFDAPSSLPVSVVVEQAVDSMSMSTAMTPDDNSALDVTPLLLQGLQSCELNANLNPDSDIIGSDCEHSLNKELILDNVPTSIQQVCDDGMKGVLPNIGPVPGNLTEFPITNNSLPLSATGPNVILAPPSYTVPAFDTNVISNINQNQNVSQILKPAETLQINNLLPITSVVQTDTSGNLLHGQQIRVEFNKISADTTIVKLCFAPQSDSGLNILNQNLIFNNQQLLTTLLNGSKTVESTPIIESSPVLETVNSEDVNLITGETNETETLGEEASESIEDPIDLDAPVNDEDDDKPLQQLKDEMTFALETGLEKDSLPMSPTCSQMTPEEVILDTQSLPQIEGMSHCDMITEEQGIEVEAVEGSTETETPSTTEIAQAGQPEVEISSLLTDIKVKMKTLAKLDEISIQINDSQYEAIEGKGRWCCNKCDKSYTTKHNLIIHTLGHHGIKPHVCAVCKRMFSQRSHLKTHILTHGNIRPYSCEICHRSFTQLSHVKRHISTHMEKRPYHCDECDRGFAYPSELKAHQIKHKRKKDHKCVQCSATFEDPKKLAFHLKTNHRDPSELTCNICGREYTYPSQLRDHMVKHTGMRPYTCEECGMDFMKEHHLKSHIYTHSGMKPWECNVCSRTFNQKANMLRHMLIHNDQRKFECEVCHKTFSQPQTLKAHRVIHSDKKPYSCRLCGKEFGRLHTLQGHMHVHLDSRPHVCFCGAAFTLKGNLTRHKKVKHDLSDPNQCTEEEAAKILEIMSTKRRGPASEAETGSCSDTSKDLEEETEEGIFTEEINDTDEMSSATKDAGNANELDALACLKPTCNDTGALLALDASPIVENFHSYCVKDANSCDSN